MSSAKNPHIPGSADAEYWDQAAEMVRNTGHQPPPDGAVDCMIASIRDGLADRAAAERRRAAESGSH